MEQPRHREAAEGGDRSWEPPGDGGSSAGDSAAANGSCGRAPVPGLEDEDDEHDLSGPSCSCRYRREVAALSSPAAVRLDGSCSLSCRHRDTSGTREDEEGTGARRLQRRQHQRSAPKENENGRRRDGTAGRRHWPPRKRSRGDGAEPPGLAEEPAGYLGLLTSYRGLLARVLRLGTEAGERLLGSCSCFGDRSWVWGWCRWAARWLHAGAWFILRLLWLLLALLLLLLVLLLGCLRLGAAAVAASAVWLAGTRWVARLLEAAVALRGTWGLLGDSGMWHRLRDWLWEGGTQHGGGTAPSCAGGAPGAREETRRLLAAANIPEEQLNPFQVLGVEATASDAELRRAYRRLAVLVRGCWGRVSLPQNMTLRVMFCSPPPGAPGQERAPTGRGSVQGAAGGLGHRQQPRAAQGVRAVSGGDARGWWQILGIPPDPVVLCPPRQQATGGAGAVTLGGRVPEPAAG